MDKLLVTSNFFFSLSVFYPFRALSTIFIKLDHTSTNTTFLSKDTDYFSHMLLQRQLVMIKNKGINSVLLVPGDCLQTLSVWFLRVCSTSLLKTQSEKEKLLVTSNFFFSLSVFYPFRELSTIFIKLVIDVCKLFHFGRV